jgi:5-methylcytosine-specific restriction endonuclease McrA
VIDRPPTFQKWLPPRSVAKPVKAFAERQKPDRNKFYDSRWDRLAIAFRKRHPFCDECEKNGNDTVLAQVTGHIIPARDDPDLRLDWKNLRSLCTRCNAVMAVIEEHARKHGLTKKLPEWCEDPQTRPLKFRPPPVKRIKKQ